MKKTKIVQFCIPHTLVSQEQELAREELVQEGCEDIRVEGGQNG